MWEMDNVKEGKRLNDEIGQKGNGQRFWEKLTERK